MKGRGKLEENPVEWVSSFSRRQDRCIFLNDADDGMVRVTRDVRECPLPESLLTICRAAQVVALRRILNYFAQRDIKGAVFVLNAGTHGNSLAVVGNPN